MGGQRTTLRPWTVPAGAIWPRVAIAVPAVLLVLVLALSCGAVPGGSRNGGPDSPTPSAMAGAAPTPVTAPASMISPTTAATAPSVAASGTAQGAAVAGAAAPTAQTTPSPAVAPTPVESVATATPIATLAVATVGIAEDLTSVAIDSTRNLVYLSHSRDGAGTTIIDGASDRVIGLIEVDSWNVGVDPVARRVYLLQGGMSRQNGVTVVDSTTNSVVASVPIEGDAYEMAVDPARKRVYVSHRRANAAFITVIDSDKNVVVTRLPVAGWAQDLAINGVTNRLYVLHDNLATQGAAGLVTVIDGTALTTIATFTLPDQAGYDLAVNPATNQVFIGGDATVFVADGEDNAVVEEIPIGDGPRARFTAALGVNPTTNRIYARYESNLIVIDGATRKIVGKVPMGRWIALAIGVNPQINRIYVASGSRTGSTLRVIRDPGS